MQTLLLYNIPNILTGNVKIVDRYHVMYGQVGKIDDRAGLTTDPATGELLYTVVFNEGQANEERLKFLRPQVEVAE
ncbi:hypothetical protein SCP_0509880 [Sparassis crispa]|uniref:Uncharacterized protein n=1 Tax=Sparassis crispa TaxID=139825 RepID=A0A401GP56_9APHY|nr:hypothetical protein SCP_0509880 [Sparassis crispa]GBE83929.1 hypothetical protein SCP_0509880 [Sparassis crispa]